MIIGLEGVSCVGKTTLANALADRLPAVAVACYFHAAPDPSWLPEPTAATAAEQLDNLVQLLRVEALRRHTVVQAVTDGHTVILDRTVDTLLAHAHAMGRLYSFDCDEQARAMVLSGPAVIPDLTLLLSADPAEVAVRASRRVDMPVIFYEPRFTAHFHEHFAQPLASHCVRLESTTTPEDVVKLALDVITRPGVGVGATA